MKVRAQFPDYCRDMFKPRRYKVLYGGRGAGRSWSFARILLILGSKHKLRILCCREFQKSIADSVHKLLADQILLMELPGWKVGKKEITHVVTGTTFIFEGLRYNTNRIKSIEGIDICWVEEAESVTKDSWETLIPTIRKPGSEIWISFNPDNEEDPTYKRFVVESPPNAFVMKVGWQDNPWFPDTLREEKDYLYRVDPDAAEYVWGGIPRKISDAQVLRGKWRVEAFKPQDNWQGPFFGADFGFSEDPNTCVQLYIHKKPEDGRLSSGRLYVYREAWKIREDIHRIRGHWVKTFGTHLPQQVIRADSARPETISYLQQHGLRRMVPTAKWNGSVEDGLAYLRQFEEIVVHPQCPHYIQECRLYSYKVDGDGEVTNKLVDKHNHLIDATRYALVKRIRARKASMSGYSGMSY